MSGYSPTVEGTVSQEQSRQLVHPSVTVLPSKANRWALIIGVDKYDDDNISPLYGATNDANALANALKDHAGFPENQIIVLTSDQDKSRRPTRLNILKYLSNLKNLVPKGGLLLFSFAGHGIENNGRAFIIPFDAAYTDNIKLLQQTAIEVNTIKEAITDSEATQVLIFLDACRNDPLSGRADSVNPLTDAYVHAFDFDLRNQDVVAFATLYATQVGKRAYENAGKREGYFTQALVEGLSGKAADSATGEVTLLRLVKYVEATVPIRVAVDLGHSKIQKPFALIGGFKADELVLAVSAASPNKSIAPVVVTGEAALWREVERTGTQQAFVDFLKTYPRGEYASAAQFKLRKLNEEADIADEHWRRGVLAQRDNLDEAIKSFTRAIEISPSFLKAYESRAAAFSQKQAFDGAISDYTKVIELNPKSVTAYYGRGIAHEHKRELNLAIVDYTKATELSPSLFTFLSRGRVLVKNRLYDQAVANYSEALAKDKNTPDAVYIHQRGLAFLLRGDLELALADFNKALELRPTESEFYNSRGQYYAAKKEYTKAVGDYTSAIKWRWGVKGVPGTYNLQPHNYLANRGMAYFGLGNYDAALDDLNRAISLVPQIAPTYHKRAAVYEAKGDAKRALQDRNTAIDVENKSLTKAAIDDHIAGVTLDLNRYCMNTYPDSSAVLSGPTAFGWKCQRLERGQTTQLNINTSDVCKMQFGPWAVAKLGITGIQIAGTARRTDEKNSAPRLSLFVGNRGCSRKAVSG